ncbi:MAG: MFS transporter, partial [Bacteroidales bacterium]|nr:MFS transporter [Bacteroidales bacterium]
IIDKSGRKRLLLWSLFFYAVGGTSGFYLTNIYLLLLGRSVLGIAVAGIMTINTTLIGDYFQGRNRSNFMGWQGAFMGFGGVFFVSAGGLLADISWRWPFLVYSISIILLVMARNFLYEPEISRFKDYKILPAENHLTFKTYLLLYLTTFFGMLFFYLIPTQVPFLLGQAAVLKNSSIGFTISGAVLAGALVSLVYGKIRRRFNFHQIFIFTFLLMGSGYLITALSSDFSGIFSGLIIAGLGTGMFMPNANLWLVSVAPPEKRGRMVGLLNTAVYSGQFLSPIFIFPINHYRSINFSFLVCGTAMLLMACCFYLLNTRRSK